MSLYCSPLSLSLSSTIFLFLPSTLDVAKEFQEEAYSVAIHPSGLFLLVGFSEKLRLMNVLIDDIRPFKEIMIRGCREVIRHIIFNILLSIFLSAHSVMEVISLQQLMLISSKSMGHSLLTIQQI